MPNTVRYYDSTMSGAPTLSGTAGALIGVLDACLKDGFGSVTVNSLVVASNVATATVSGGHQFAMLGTVGPVIRITGATPSGLNGDWRVTVTNTTVFTFVTTGISDQTATGTITALRAPAGFTKLLTGTANKCAYQADDITGNRHLLRLDDSSTLTARIRGYTVIANQTDFNNDTGSDPFPTDAQLSGGSYVFKSATANGTARPWQLIADQKLFYLFTQYNTGEWASFCFGDGVSLQSADAYMTLLVAHKSGSVVSNDGLGWINNPAPAPSHAMPRSYAQTGTAINPIAYGNYRTGTLFTGANYPNPAGNQLLVHNLHLWDSSTTLRGMFPGFYYLLHLHSTVTDGVIVDGISGMGLSNRTIKIVKLTYSGTQYFPAAVDLTGPWR